MKIYSIGIGPGKYIYLTPQAKEALKLADVIIGYTPYFKYIDESLKGKELLSTGMKKEEERASIAFDKAKEGKNVAVISSGDSGVYGMAPLLIEMKIKTNSDIEVEVIPGISAMFAAAAVLGAPLGHDFCSISLSDLLTPWKVIEKRIKAAIAGDFVCAIYNPISKGRFWQLMRLRELFLEGKNPQTPVGIVRNVGRKDETVSITTLEKLDTTMADMFTVIIIGNSQSYVGKQNIITPRGYYRKKGETKDNLGRQIMNNSFQTILQNIDISNKSLAHIWVALHCIHTTADFNMNNLIEITNDAVPKLYDAFYGENPPVIITDVSMITQGIRKSIAKKLGLSIKCYLLDERVQKIAQENGITRTQAGIRLAVQEHPNALFAFGNAPTALMELVKLIRQGKANPQGVIASPVGFVNVEESKWQMKYGCKDIPTIFVNGRKGGSNVAATIINSILSWNEAENMHPGEGV